MLLRFLVDKEHPVPENFTNGDLRSREGMKCGPRETFASDLLCTRSASPFDWSLDHQLGQVLNPGVTHW